MAKRYKIYPIKTIKDWQGEDWDVYEERNTQAGIMIYKGWMYERIAKSQYIFILTDDLAEFLKQHDRAKSMKLLGLSVKIITRFRRALGLQKKYDYTLSTLRDWMFEHQDELFTQSFQMLKEKYGLTQTEVTKYCTFLRKQGVQRSNKLRKNKIGYANRKIVQNNKEALAKSENIFEVQSLLNKKNLKAARRAHNLVCKELGIPTLNDIRVQRLNEKKEWRLEHKEIILSTQYSIKEIAIRLNKTEQEILTSRSYLKELLGEKKRVPLLNWVRAHQQELNTLSIKELCEKFNLTVGAVMYRRKLLKRNET
ncbi:hypothetical protein M2R48_11105 [Acinetobacter sp. I-MWF]|uniref:hypothetical protein n=1 Tax=Acinetobacter sp. I-MWF TaxID=2940517 RepID=UPI0021C5778E|nr:hypothetical protein [Acinetobacter sp. I-MWF]MCT9978878.1 hypothetical protein [Acinetobacter sp. I-MWF]